MLRILAKFSELCKFHRFFSNPMEKIEKFWPANSFKNIRQKIFLTNSKTFCICQKFFGTQIFERIKTKLSSTVIQALKTAVAVRAASKM
jgi:hypothetical protein